MTNQFKYCLIREVNGKLQGIVSEYEKPKGTGNLVRDIVLPDYAMAFTKWQLTCKTFDVAEEHESNMDSLCWVTWFAKMQKATHTYSESLVIGIEIDPSLIEVREPKPVISMSKTGLKHHNYEPMLYLKEPKEGQDELWREIETEYFNFYFIDPKSEDSVSVRTEYLKSKFIISRKA